MTTEKKIDFSLTHDEASLIVVAMESGLINLHSFKTTLENIFMDKKTEEQHAELMKKIFDVKRKVIGAIIEFSGEQLVVEKDVDSNPGQD